MGAYASNSPISRPINTGDKVDADFGGILWSKKFGFIFAPQDEMLPLRLPPNPPRKAAPTFERGK